MSHRCRCMHFASKNGFRIVEGLFLGFVDRSGLHGHSQEPLCGYRAKDKNALSTSSAGHYPQANEWKGPWFL
jgi:hypothetical protein